MLLCRAFAGPDDIISMTSLVRKGPRGGCAGLAHLRHHPYHVIKLVLVTFRLIYIQLFPYGLNIDQAYRGRRGQ